MDDYEWAKPFRPRCRVRLNKKFFIYKGRCELRRDHYGPHALERGMEIVEFETITTVKLSKMAELVVQQELARRRRED